MDSLSKETLEKSLEQAEDWYRAVLFDNNGKVVAVKNSPKLDEKELQYIKIQ